MRGPIAALTFNDVGIASTHAGVTVSTAKGIFNRLAAAKPEVIVAELGDGILGEYGVQDILRDAELMRVGAAYVMAAPDPVACWGAAELMRREFGLPITAITGPATDNEVGQVYITDGAWGCRRTTRGGMRLGWWRSCGSRWTSGSRVTSHASGRRTPRLVCRDSRLVDSRLRLDERRRRRRPPATPAASCCVFCSSTREVTECVATSRSQAGKPIGEVHPALATVTDARFAGTDARRDRAGPRRRLSLPRAR